MDLKQWLDTPEGLRAYAPTIYAMLAAVGWNPEEADEVEELICGRYQGLTETSEASATTYRRIRLEHDWDGDEYCGLNLLIEVGHISDENLPQSFVDAVKEAQR